MRWPRKGILIRLAIYGPIIGFLSYNACQVYRARRGAEEAASQPSVEERLAPHKRVITMPDGTKQEIYELTPEEAKALLGEGVAFPEEAKPAEPKAGAEPEPEATAEPRGRDAAAD